MYNDAVRIVCLMWVAGQFRYALLGDELDAIFIDYRNQIIQSIDLIIQGKQ